MGLSKRKRSRPAEPPTARKRLSVDAAEIELVAGGYWDVLDSMAAAPLTDESTTPSAAGGDPKLRR